MQELRQCFKKNSLINQVFKVKDLKKLAFNFPPL